MVDPRIHLAAGSLTMSKAARSFESAAWLQTCRFAGELEH